MHYNRQPLLSDDRDPWKSLFINIDSEDLCNNRPHPIVNICGSTAIHRHEITFLTGSSHCRAHAMAKMITAAVLQGSYPYAQSLQVARQASGTTARPDDNPPAPGKVLWIDTVHSLYTVCGFIDDLKHAFNVSNDNFRVLSLDHIGTFNERDQTVHVHIINAIRDFRPTLVVIDDLDHLTPECGIMLPDKTSVEARYAEETTVRDIFTAVIPRDTSVSPDELLSRLNKRSDDMNRLNRNRHLIANAIARGILNRNDDGNYDINSDYYITPDADNAPRPNFIDSYIRNLQRSIKVPLIPTPTDPKSLTFINAPARPSISSTSIPPSPQ